MDAAARMTTRAARVRQNRVVLISRRWDQARGLFSRATVTKKPGHRGERAISRKTIAQGKPECLGVPVFTRVLSALISRIRGCGCDVHPAFPAPSLFPRDNDDASPGQILPRERWCLSPSAFMPREGGASSIPETSRLNATVSGILDRPIKSGDDSEPAV
jgi:hypothetical protein